MEVIKMQTNNFWKGEVGVRGLVEDQAQTYNVSLYVKGGRVKDYSCSCAEGNSYKGMCAHGKALFAYYEDYAKRAGQPPVHTSQEVHTMIREYTNRQVSRIMAAEEAEKADLVPVLLLSARRVQLEFKVGRDRYYLVKDLTAFAQAVRENSYVEYSKTFGFHHCAAAFTPESRGLLTLVMELAELVKPQREAELAPVHRDRFFDLVMDRMIEVQLPGGTRTRLWVERRDPRLQLTARRYGRDGIKISFDGVLDGEEPRRIAAGFGGEQHLYLAQGERLCQCSRDFTQAMQPFLEQINREGSRTLLVGEKDIPLFYARVLKSIAPYAAVRAEDVDWKSYEPQPLRAQFKFDSRGLKELLMEPCLSYGDFSFHPVEDENLPRSVCRDVPGEFKISQVINRYFRYKELDGIRLVIRDDEEAVYRLLTEGIEEFRKLGEVMISEELKQWKVLAPPKVSVGVSVNKGWLNLTVDTGGLSDQELAKILAAYSQKKKYYRLKSGEFLQLGEGGLYTVARLAKELGISRKELQSRTVSLPAYRAMYLDSVLKEGPGVAYYRDQLMKALVRGLRSVEDSDYPVPEQLQGVLREYQKTGFHWMKTLDANGFGGILADDMGLGKTIQTIALLEDAYGGEQKEGEPSLIVCPASLVYNWEHEIRKFAPDLTIRSVVGNAGEREEILREASAAPGETSVFITSYDLLKRDVEQYGELHFRFQIIDEAQYIKNAATQSARAVKAVNAGTRFALTGTPVENRLGELWSIFDYLMPGFLFGAQHFRKEYELPVVRDQDGEALDRLRRITGPFILRRVKKDVLRELPDKLETVVYSRMEEEQKNLYAAGAARLKERLDRSEGEGLGEERFQVLADLTRLRQICCDPRLCYENYKGGSAKLETCMDLVRRGVEGEHKILLFSQFTSMLELIESRLNQEGIASYKLTGATSKEERMRLVGEFASDATPVFLISLKAGGTGLNLTAADIVIHYDPWWNVAAQNQATDRSHRIGQDKQVTVFKLIARNTVEENILTLQESKSRLSDQVITGDGGSFGGLTREDVLRILA